MLKLNEYKTVQQFLDACNDYLYKNEIENSLILGLCAGIENKNEEKSKYKFLTVTDNERIECASIKLSSRAIISGNDTPDEAIRMLSEFYFVNSTDFDNVMGVKSLSERFAEVIPRKQVNKRELILHELEKTNPVTLAKGEFEKAAAEDLKSLVNFRTLFDKETFGFLRLSVSEIENDLMNKISQGFQFCWKANDEVVSMACIMRNTNNIAIIGQVFTTELSRGKGYGTSTVMCLSNEILRRGFKKCGLYTDKTNPTSNDIYFRIGYKPSAEFTDIYFERT